MEERNYAPQPKVVTDKKEEQFRRELRIRAIAGSNKRDAASRAARQPKAQANVTLEQRRAAREAGDDAHLLGYGVGSKARLASGAVREGPRMLFDADATLNITMQAARELAVERVERKASRPGAKAAQEVLAEATVELAAEAKAADVDGDAAPSAHQPDTREEFESEVAWLRRKQSLAREDCARAESLLREKARGKKRQLTLAEATADETLSNARRRYNKYSRRLVGLQRLLAPGERFGPQLAVEKEGGAAEGEEAPRGGADGVAPRKGGVGWLSEAVAELAVREAATEEAVKEAAKQKAEASRARWGGGKTRVVKAGQYVSMFTLAADRQEKDLERKRCVKAGEPLPWGVEEGEEDVTRRGSLAASAALRGASPLQRNVNYFSTIISSEATRHSPSPPRRGSNGGSSPTRRGSPNLSTGRLQAWGGSGAERTEAVGRGTSPAAKLAGSVRDLFRLGGDGDGDGGDDRGHLSPPVSPGKMRLVSGRSPGRSPGSPGSFVADPPSPPSSPGKMLGELLSPGKMRLMGGTFSGDLTLEAQELLEDQKTVWSVRIRHVRQAMELRSVADAHRLLSSLQDRALRQATRTPPPVRALGVVTDNRFDGRYHGGSGGEELNQEVLEHAWMVERAGRLGEALHAMEDDARRRFVMGREAYEQDVQRRCTACRPNPGPSPSPSPNPTPSPNPNPNPNPNPHQGGGPAARPRGRRAAIRGRLLQGGAVAEAGGSLLLCSGGGAAARPALPRARRGAVLGALPCWLQPGAGERTHARAHTLHAHCMCTACALHAHCMLHCMCTACCTACALHAHCMLHCMCTACALHAHCLHRRAR